MLKPLKSTLFLTNNVVKHHLPIICFFDYYNRFWVCGNIFCYWHIGQIQSNITWHGEAGKKACDGGWQLAVVGDSAETLQGMNGDEEPNSKL
jgi:hypothetical protein